jgi:hypothetical protein
VSRFLHYSARMGDSTILARRESGWRNFELFKADE